jgi:hypothetical protein
MTRDNRPDGAQLCAVSGRGLAKHGNCRANRLLTPRAGQRRWPGVPRGSSFGMFPAVESALHLDAVFTVQPLVAAAVGGASRRNRAGRGGHQPAPLLVMELSRVSVDTEVGPLVIKDDPAPVRATEDAPPLAKGSSSADLSAHRMSRSPPRRGSMRAIQSGPPWSEQRPWVRFRVNGHRAWLGRTTLAPPGQP